MTEKLKANIEISINTITSNYKLDSITEEIIKALYSGIYPDYIHFFKTADLINKDKDNKLETLNNFNDNTGVYIFLNNDNIPVYIGVSGEKDSIQSLKKRISLQLNGNESNSTLAKNIKELEKLLNNIDFALNDKSDYKQLILDYAPKFIVIDKGILNHNNVEKSQSLEKILIAIFNSKYNK